MQCFGEDITSHYNVHYPSTFGATRIHPLQSTWGQMFLFAFIEQVWAAHDWTPRGFDFFRFAGLLCGPRMTKQHLLSSNACAKMQVLIINLASIPKDPKA